MTYDAFISYSHSADGEIATALQKGLRRLAKPWHQRRALEVFRDETAMAVEPHLWRAITAALDRSTWLILVTSTDGATSEWVNREIDYWATNQPIDRILPVVTGGRWQWDADAGDFTEDSDAVPPALRGVFDEEPRHLDLSWARQRSDLDLDDARFRNAVAELAAPLHGRPKDDLEGEDVRQHRRTLRTARVAAVTLSVLLIAALTGAVIAVRNANQADRRRVEADARRLIAQSSDNRDQPELAFLLAAHAHRLDPTIDARGAVLAALTQRPEFRQRTRTGDPVTAVARSAGADLVAVGTEDGDVHLHRFSDGERIATTEEAFAEPVLDLDIMTAGGEPVIVASDLETILTLDDELTVTATLWESDDVISAVAVDPSSQRIAAGTTAEEILIWDPDQTDPSVRLQAPGETGPAIPSDLAWAPDGTLISAEFDNGIRRWDPSNPGDPVWTVGTFPGVGEPDVLGRDPVTAVAVSEDDRVITGGLRGSVRFIDLEGGAPVGDLSAEHDLTVNEIAITGAPAGDGSVATVANDGQLIRWNSRTGLPVSRARVHAGSASAIGWDPSDPTTGAIGGQDGSVLLVDSRPTDDRIIGQIADHSESASVAELSADGALLAVGAPDGTITLGDSDDFDTDQATVTAPEAVTAIAVASDNRSVVAALADGQLVRWNGSSNALEPLTGPSTPMWDLDLSIDGTFVVSMSEAETGLDEFQIADESDTAVARLWNTRDGRLDPAGQLAAPPGAVAFLADSAGSIIVLDGVDELVVHDRSTGRTRRTPVKGSFGVSTATTNPDKDLLALAYGDGSVRFIDLETLDESGTALQNGSLVSAVAFTAGGDLVVTAGEDGRVRLWDAVRREPLAPALVGHSSGSPVSLAIAGGRMVTASESDGQVVSWTLDADAWIARGCERHDRELTDEEEGRFGLVDAPAVCG